MSSNHALTRVPAAHLSHAVSSRSQTPAATYPSEPLPFPSRVLNATAQSRASSRVLHRFNQTLQVRQWHLPRKSQLCLGTDLRLGSKRRRSLSHGVSKARSGAARSSLDYDALKGVQVLEAASGQPVELLSLWAAKPGVRVVIPFMTHFADLSSWEFAQKLAKKLPELQANGVRIVAVGLGSPDNARRFAETVGFPLQLLYADPTGACYRALNFSPGFAPEAGVSPYLKLLPMLMGIGSPGTIQEVARGYFGDRGSKPVFEGSTPFDILGKGYQRPMELATLRLFNMFGILQKWGEMSPPETRLLTQQGGSIVFDGEDVVFKHVDSGILKYTDVDALVAAALQETLTVTSG
ncbi:hypothetical protein KFL_002870180 [Klebsormidium nitens]|uniref:Uncharacterized protein n=1 Tax=Klebsormidium nitens TaxID=105231 RepID=A0A1Y1I630_KLENI|nr:hypothetical protein KFL_002870180 [Klebsormidium nitens]|eukprot:GAQ86414.1 hypothetical protein KFL_002870180 [Klebsormidium nitens]